MLILIFSQENRRAGIVCTGLFTPEAHKYISHCFLFPYFESVPNCCLLLFWWGLLHIHVLCLEE